MYTDRNIKIISLNSIFNVLAINLSWGKIKAKDVFTTSNHHVLNSKYHSIYKDRRERALSEFISCVKQYGHSLYCR